MCCTLSPEQCSSAMRFLKRLSVYWWISTFGISRTPLTNFMSNKFFVLALLILIPAAWSSVAQRKCFWSDLVPGTLGYLGSRQWQIKSSRWFPSWLNFCWWICGSPGIIYLKKWKASVARECVHCLGVGTTSNSLWRMNKGIWFSSNIKLDLKSKSIPGVVNTGSLRRLKLFIEYFRKSSMMKQPSTNIICRNSSSVTLISSS